MHSTIGQINGTRRYSTSEVEEAVRTLPKNYLLLDDAEIRPPRDLVRGALSNGTALVAGQSGAGKTSVLLNLATSLASGTSWFGLQVREKVGVLIIAGEGYGGLPRKLTAELIHRKITGSLPIVMTPNNRDLMNAKQFEALLAELRSVSVFLKQEFDVWLRVVIIDTIAACFAMKDENSNSEAAAVCTRLQRIADEIKGACIGVHHHGKNAETGPRGASAFRAGVDNIISVLADRDESQGTVSNRRLVLTKARDGAEGTISHFDLKFIELGIDDYGEPYGSVIAEPTEASASAASNNEPKSHKTFHAAFSECLNTHGRDHRVMESHDIPSPTVLAAPLEALRKEFSLRWATAETDPKKREDAVRKAFKRVLGSVRGYGTEAVRGEELIWRI